MQIFSWPAPPIIGMGIPPEIPCEYTSFGIEYSVVGGSPVSTSFERSKFDMDKLRMLVDLSFSTFAELIACPFDANELVDNIKSIHIEINQILNGSKKTEAIGEMLRIRNQHVKNRNMLAEDVKRQISNFEI
ncbi:hypothetical protein OCOL_000438 [Ordospora colligata]|uniref:Mediator of RNA polymerase II transcription subunit 7 n=1 Tax=Ordospora colligata OC4 TaxID=1354746 RepID=A0A0B2UIV6_9MICR|nr:uncharacterized protein M896_110200 [Ordospora colligata OC4]KHN68992.1 hypothetical protein M896_110200 [Ordospora colligata OC4]TBU14220.1 hypothetical protein CWI40_110200 [Ordospora colligata]TBU14267.1 hypothetical protein CWI41_110200 [Ordospora colligata]